jgi:hypothetical protein
LRPASDVLFNRFSTLQRRFLRLGDFHSGDHLAASIMAFIDTYNRLHAEQY